MRCQFNNFYERKPDFFQKRYSINNINKDELKKEYLHIQKKSYDFDLYESDKYEINPNIPKN